MMKSVFILFASSKSEYMFEKCFSKVEFCDIFNHDVWLISKEGNKHEEDYILIIYGCVSFGLY